MTDEELIKRPLDEEFDTMTDIQRYDCDLGCECGNLLLDSMEQDDSGDWVSFDDHQARIDALETKLAKAIEALHFYADFYEVPNDGPWGSGSTDFGHKAYAALKELRAKV
jgi:hypothetical protein